MVSFNIGGVMKFVDKTEYLKGYKKEVKVLELVSKSGIVIYTLSKHKTWFLSSKYFSLEMADLKTNDLNEAKTRANNMVEKLFTAKIVEVNDLDIEFSVYKGRSSIVK